MGFEKSKRHFRYNFLKLTLIDFSGLRLLPERSLVYGRYMTEISIVVDYGITVENTVVLIEIFIINNANKTDRRVSRSRAAGKMRQVWETCHQYLRMYCRDPIFRLASIIALHCVCVKLANMGPYYGLIHFLIPVPTKFQQDFSTECQNECGVVPEGINMYPWLVQVIISITFLGLDGPAGSCGGAFISNQHVITAQHCLITAGARIHIVHNGNSYEAEVVANSPNYDAGMRFRINRHTDVALLKLKTVPNGCVIPICLPTNDLIMNDLTKASFRIFPWAMLQADKFYHEEMISVIDGEACHEKYIKNYATHNVTECDEKPQIFYQWADMIFQQLENFWQDHFGKARPESFKKEQISDEFNFNFLCSGSADIKVGDSGSPLMQKDENNKWTLAAIVRGIHGWSNQCVNDTLYGYYDYQTIFPRLSWVLQSMKK